MKFHTLYLALFILGSFAFLVLLIFVCLIKPGSISANTNYWQIQSIDTMKYSRDMARERNKDAVFERIIDSVVEKIASSGATHVALGTPYDSEFYPFLRTWVNAARREGLNVWFRGNFSGWEGWFDYPEISKEEHLEAIKGFILANSDIFDDGDIFTPCTECENGVIGDPRRTGDLTEFREFLISEYDISGKAFAEIGKAVKTGYFSMNADVARLVMDKETTMKLGGVVVIDHYVKDPVKLITDIDEISNASGGKIVLGEMGVPIPDIHGSMSNLEQERWISEAFDHLSKSKDLIGINYWVSFGGSTAIWNNDGSEKPAVGVLRSYFLPNMLSGRVVNEIGKPVENALITADSKQTHTDEEGRFEIASNPTLERMVINASGYKDTILVKGLDLHSDEIIIEKEKENLLFKLRKILYNFVEKIKK
jgi:hypothetical protein